MKYPQPSEPGRSSPTVPGIRYAIGMTCGHLLTAAEVAGLVIFLSRETVTGARTLLTSANLGLLIAVVVVGTVAMATAGYRSIAPSVRWYLAGATPDPDQQRDTVNIVRRQTVILLTTWFISGAVLIAANWEAGPGPVLLMVVSVSFGGASSISTSLLFTQHIVRPIVAAASKDTAASADSVDRRRENAPGIAARLVMMWVFNSAMPSVAIALLIVSRANGWFITESASLDIPIIVLLLVSILLGLRALILVSQSISDPVRDVAEAMSEIEHGTIGRTVDVYEQSEIGRLQSGFNRMVTGLVERDRLRDLFGRHVGLDVARRAIETDEAVAGEVRDVAILFIDLADSTQLAVQRTPQEVADILNDFFRIVVAAVDEHGGLINKFQGDAALAVFGAPIRTDDAAAAALAAARTLATNLRLLPDVDFGIGVSAGAVFAGNIGAENRYEYTVIGDPVNEAARLADAAKSTHGKTVASGAAISRASCADQEQWAPAGSVVLRGRTEATQQWVPRDDNDFHD